MSFANSTSIDTFAGKQLRQDCLGPVGSFFDEFFDSRRLFEDLCLGDDSAASTPSAVAPVAISADDEEDSDELSAMTAKACSIASVAADRNSPSPLLSPSDTESFASTVSSDSSPSSSSLASRHRTGRIKTTSDDDTTRCKRERNRQAAERCRKRKADLIASLQSDCDQLRQEKDALVVENKRLRAMLGFASPMQM